MELVYAAGRLGGENLTITPEVGVIMGFMVITAEAGRTHTDGMEEDVLLRGPVPPALALQTPIRQLALFQIPMT
jgi:hypothetical protein